MAGIGGGGGHANDQSQQRNDQNQRNQFTGSHRTPPSSGKLPKPLDGQEAGRVACKSPSAMVSPGVVGVKGPKDRGKTGSRVPSESNSLAKEGKIRSFKISDVWFLDTRE